MSEHIADAAIPDDVMAEAARAICDQNDAWWEDAGPLDREVYVDYVRVALPILTLAIERSLIERMIADVDKQIDRFGVNQMDAYMRLRLSTYLPTEDEEAT